MTLESFETSLADWRGRLTALDVPAALRAAGVRPESLIGTVDHLRRRCGAGARAAVRIAVFGPTGVGKSKIFNSLAGEVVSPSSYLRPCTRVPIYYVHAASSELDPSIAGELRSHRSTEWADCILIDTPDFDSVEEAQHEIAERVYLESDAFIFVTDPHKYGDASTWNYVSRLLADKKPCLFVMNKAGDDGPIRDFELRIGQESDTGERVVVFPIRNCPADDATLLADDSELSKLRQAVLDLASVQGPDVLVKSFRLDFDRFHNSWQRFHDTAVQSGRSMSDVRAALDKCVESHRQSLLSLLETDVDPAVKEEVYQELLSRLERIDVLRYPRKILALPLVGAKRLLGQFFPVFGDGEKAPGGARGDSAFHESNKSGLEALLVDFTEEALEIFRDNEVLGAMLDEGSFRALRPSSAEISELYDQQTQKYLEWVEGEARQTAAELTNEHKLKFILSQLIYNTAVIGFQLKTFGVLSVGEIVADGVLSPMVARAVGMAISSEGVGKFEKEATRRHVDIMSTVLESAHERFLEFLSAAELKTPALDAIEAMHGEIEEVLGGVEALVRAFEREKAGNS
jgi:hypothetical protein